MPSQPFVDIGKKTQTIPVRISYRIIELFSEGLYSSPHKAIEELVSNAFDAGARNVSVILSPDRTSQDAIIAVIDDGEGMDAEGLRQHWLIGVSNKRTLEKLPRNRRQIGKFGIGKLATFVLARYLTHVCKRGAKYYATTMDYGRIPHGEGGGIHAEETVELDLRELTEAQAKQAISQFTSGSKPGYKAIRFFGSGATASWTVAIMSGLKGMATEIQKGRLSWVLRTAMPLRDDFKIFLDGEALAPSKASIRVLKKWVIGKDLKKLPKPAPDDLEVTKDEKALPENRCGLTHPQLGRFTGYIEVYDDLLTGGKSEELGRSNGFFIYVLGRLINLDDELFGMPALRHGTFARFRMVVHMDRLDKELRSSRENVREGPLVNVARALLHGAFNQARSWLEEYEAKQTPSMRATGRIAQTPGSLTRRPILALVKSAFEKKASPKLSVLPSGLPPEKQEQLLQVLLERAETEQGLVLGIETQDLAQDQGIAQFYVESGTLVLNGLHPFVAAFRDDSSSPKDALILLAMAEVLTEAHLYEMGLAANIVRDVMSRRDELLRQFARSTAKRNASVIAQALVDASSDQDKLEEELVACFGSMGYEAVRIGGSGKADGKAEAHLGAAGGKERRYSMSLEAKSKERQGTKVTAKAVDVAAVIQHRDDLSCDHAVVVAPDFPTGKGDESNLIKQATTDKEHHKDKTSRTITYVRIIDLAQLVRIVPLKGIGLDRLRQLFETCISPDDAQKWIDALANEKPTKRPFGEILDTIWELQQKRPFEAIEFSAVTTALQMGEEQLVLSKEELINYCKAMSMISSHIVLREGTVEITQPPAQVISSLRAGLQKYPEEEQRKSFFKF